MAQYYLDLIPIDKLQFLPPAYPWEPTTPWSAGYHDLGGGTWNFGSWTMHYASDDLVRVGVLSFNDKLADDDDAGQKVKATSDSSVIGQGDPITNEYELNVEINGEIYRLVAVSSGDKVIGFTFDGAWPPADTEFTSIAGSSEDIQELGDPQPAPGEDPFPPTSDPETGDGPIWMWIGNQTQFNATPETNLTPDEVDAISGYRAAGPNEIKPVDMDGEVLGGNFQTTYNPTYGIGSGHGGTDMSYVDPATGERVSDAHITTAVLAPITVYDLDDDGNEVVVGTFPGLVVQMDNGDVFFRPYAGTQDQWNVVTRIYRIEIGDTTITDDTTAISIPPSLNADIYDVQIIPCFAGGTLISTVKGDVAIESLSVGDLVLTKDNGFQPIRWIGSRKLGPAMLAIAPNLRPIRIRAGALGKDMPSTDLVVSPQHRIFVRSSIAHRMFGAAEVLVAAKQLLQIDGVEVAEDMAEVEYFHMLFERHEVIFSNGAATESLYTGPQALRSLGKQAREEIFSIFPELLEGGQEWISARPLVSGRQARKLAARHSRNDKDLVATH